MLTQEMKKTLFHSYGILLVILLAAGVSMYRLEDGFVKNTRLESCREQYQFLDEAYGLTGVYTEAKETKLADLEKKNQEELNRRNRAVEEYLAGSLDYSEYLKVIQETEKVYLEEEALEQFRNQYEAAKEAPEYVRALYDNGWWRLIYQPGIWLSLLAALVLSACVWLPEYHGDEAVHDFLVTTINGRKRAVCIKLGLLCGMIFVEQMLEQGIFFIGTRWKYPFAYGDASIRSLGYPADAEFGISLAEAFFLQAVLRFLWIYAAALLFGIVAMYVRDIYALLAVTGTAVCVTGIYFWKDAALAFIFSDCRWIWISAVTGLAAVSFMCWWIVRLWESGKKRTYTRKSAEKAKKMLTVCGLFLLSFLMTGCGIQNTEKGEAAKAAETEERIYNGYSSQWIWDGEQQTCFYADDGPKIYRKDAGMVYEMNLDPLADTGVNQLVHLSGKRIYHLNQFEEYWTLWDYDEQYHHRDLIRERGNYSIKNQMMGEENADYSSSLEWTKRSLHTPVTFLVEGEKLYYLSLDGLWSRDLNGGKENCLAEIDYVSPYLSLKGKEIYYLGGDFMLRSYHMESGQITEFERILTEEFEVCTEGIVFNDIGDQQELCLYRFETKQTERLNIGPVRVYTTEDEMLYYIDGENQLVKRNLLDGREEKVTIFERKPFSIKKLSGVSMIGAAFEDEGGIRVQFLPIAALQ